MEEKLKSLIEYIQSNGRVCPMPIFWTNLWEMLPDTMRKDSGGWDPPLPLILAAWWDVSTDDKKERLLLHIKYAAEHGILDKIDKFLRALTPDQWAYGDGTTDWKTWKNE